MKLSDLAKQPQLIAVRLDDNDTLAEYGEALEFWTWDRQPMDVFLRLASIQPNDHAQVFRAVRGLILDESGKEIITDDVTLPTAVMLRVITKVTEELGKSPAAS